MSEPTQFQVSLHADGWCCPCCPVCELEDEAEADE